VNTRNDSNIEGKYYEWEAESCTSKWEHGF